LAGYEGVGRNGTSITQRTQQRVECWLWTATAVDFIGDSPRWSRNRRSVMIQQTASCATYLAAKFEQRLVHYVSNSHPVWSQDAETFTWNQNNQSRKFLFTKLQSRFKWLVPAWSLASQTFISFAPYSYRPHSLCIARRVTYFAQRKMKLLTHNFLNCAAKTCKASPDSFPLKFEDVELTTLEMDYNPQFIINVLPRVEWPALVQTAIEV